jgi:HAMP domain-containing protein
MQAAAVVASAPHALLSGYLGYALSRGAKRAARRYLATMCMAFAVYSVTMGLSYASSRPIADALATLAGDCGLVAALSILGFARVTSARLSGGIAKDAAPLARRRVWAILSVGAAASVYDLWMNLKSEHTVVYALLVPVLLFGLILTTIRTLARPALGTEPRARRAARTYILLFAVPIPNVFVYSATRFGVPMQLYRIESSLSLLLFLYLLLVAYMDHGDEPISLQIRFIAGSLTIVLTVLAVVGEIVVATTNQVDGAIMLGAIAGAGVAVLILVPRFYRRNLVEPIDRLVAGMERLQHGERDLSLAIASNDELGYVTGSFNRLVRSLAETEGGLATKLAEVRALNEELRHQVAARSRELAQALARAQPASLAPGEIVDERYRVESVLGSGGMGTVYAVRRLHDGRRLALKVLQATTSESIGRFAREAQIAASLDHENLVSIVDVGIERGMVYMAMELVEGGSLEEHRERFGDIAWASRVLAQLARALAALHERGIVHRDLKPANVLLARDGERNIVKVTDFGIAVQNEDPLALTVGSGGNGRSRLTSTGVMVGTLLYMAPELADGARASFAADIFAFGLMAHEIFTGQSAFDAPPVLIARASLPSPRSLPSTIPSPLAAMLADCLCPDPARRPSAHTIASAWA